MEQQLSENFVRGFAKECFDMGLSEKQASVALEAYMEKQGFARGAAQFGKGIGQLLGGAWNIGAPLARLGKQGLKWGFKIGTPFRYLPEGTKTLGALAEAAGLTYGINELGKTDNAIGDFLNHTIGAGSWFNGGLRGGDFDPRVLRGSRGGDYGGYGENSYERLGEINTSSQGPLAPRYWNEAEPAAVAANSTAAALATPRRQGPVLLDDEKSKIYASLSKDKARYNKEISRLEREMAATNDPALRQSLSGAMHRAKQQRASADTKLRSLALESNKHLSHQQDIARLHAEEVGNQSSQLARDIANANANRDAYNTSSWANPKSWGSVGKYWLSRIAHPELYTSDSSRIADMARRQARRKQLAEEVAKDVGNLPTLNP